MAKIIENLEFEKIGARKRFIKENESGIYAGKNVDGDDVVIHLSQGIGMDVKTRKASKPNWYEVVEYNAGGTQISVTYESIKDIV